MSGFRSQSFDQDTRHRLRMVTSSPGIIKAKQEAELRRRVEDWKMQKDRIPLGQLILNWAWLGLVSAWLLVFWGCVAYILWGVL
jgi:hypothetical protein